MGGGLRGRVVYIARTDARLPEQYFQQDLLGCEVVDADTQRVYGKLTDIFSTGANDVYQVTDGGKKLLPAVRQVVTAVDITAGGLNPPNKGIFDDAD
ncbi:MAG: ribosome maturation factor RimM [[Clostridium] leptum]